jgi:hypothetical protein
MKRDTVVQSTDGNICGCPLRNCKMATPCKLREDYLKQYSSLNSYPAPLDYSQDTFNEIYKAYHSAIA